MIEAASGLPPEQDPWQEIARLRREVERLGVFYEVGKSLTGTLDLKEILQMIMEKIRELLNPDSWSLLLVDPETRELVFEIVEGPGSESLKGKRLQPGQGIVGATAETGESVLVEDVRKDPRFDAGFDALTGTSTTSLVCVPVVRREQVLGVIELVNYLGHESFKEQDIPILLNLADYAAIALDNARYVQRIHELTITDDCTTLYNARHLGFVMDAEIYRSTRYNYEFSVVFIDLDRFKSVNDTHGHLIGSKLLRRIGDILKGKLRLIDTAFRYGGDEFVVLLPMTPKAEAIKAARRLREILIAEEFVVDGIPLRVTASFGLASFPQDGKTRREMLRAADEAMYHVKAAGRDSIAVAGEERVTK